MDLQLKKQEEAKLIIEEVLMKKGKKNRFHFKRILRYQGDTNDKKPYKLSG